MSVCRSSFTQEVREGSYSIDTAGQLTDENQTHPPPHPHSAEVGKQQQPDANKH